MRSFRNLLVVIEYKQQRQPALERALSFYNYAKKIRGFDDIRITAVLPVVQENWNLTTALALDKKGFEDSFKEKLSSWLNAYLAVNAMGISIEKHVIYSKNAGKEIVSLAKELGSDILIKTAEIHGMFDNVISTPLDWQMLRHAPIPVCIAKEHSYDPKGVIAVAMDLSNPDEFSVQMNLRLLREAQYLSTFSGCRLVVINAVYPVIPPINVNLPGFTPDSLYEESIAAAKQRIKDFARKHRISDEDCYIVEGAIEDAIVDKCHEIRPTALFIGTSARTGLASAVIGNICERIADSIDCDVYVLTPKTVVREIPTTEPSKSLFN